MTCDIRRERQWQTLLKACVYAIASVVALNALFLVLSLATASSSPRPVIQEAMRAYATGDLGDHDVLKFDAQRGNNQYNDCMVIELLVNPSKNIQIKALAPTALVQDKSFHHVCATFRHVLDGSLDRSHLYADRYARYWHGYLPVTAALLRTGDLRHERYILRILVLLSLALLLTAAITRSGPLRYLGISVATAGALFWGLPYYGQGLSFAPGDSVVVLGLSLLIFLSKRLRTLSGLVTFSAAYGSVVTYFEFLTGQLPTAACFLFVAAYFLPSSPAGPSEAARSRWTFAFSSIFAFGTAAILTVAIKLFLAATLIGTDVNQLFWENLSLYSGSLPSAGGFITTIPHAILQLLRATPVLAYGHAWSAIALLVATTAVWLAAAILAFRAGRDERDRFFAHLVGAAGVLAWIVILPTHAAIHAAFMVRILIVPVALGWSSLLNEMFSEAGSSLWRGQAAPRMNRAGISRNGSVLP